MKRLLMLACALVVCGFGVVGCGGDDKKADAPAPGGDKMAPAGDKMGGDKMAGGDAKGDDVTMKVDAAIKADDKLKDAKVMVAHKDGKVVLTGTVADTPAKKELGMVVKKTLDDAKVTDKVQDMTKAEKH